MTLVPIFRALRRAGIGLGLVAIYACTLNPQPLPPGDSSEGGAGAPALGPVDGSAGALDAAAADGAFAPPDGSPGAETAEGGAGDGGVGDGGFGDTGPGDGGASEVDGPMDAKTDAGPDAIEDEPADAAETDGEEQGA
jgi:hypothetical protein